MCGIIGYSATNPSSFQKKRERFSGAIDDLKHRGPDNSGLWESDQKIVLGHTRLSIIDLSADGNQPFHHEKLSISWNGEIFNYIEVREQLKKEGIAFRTQTDTEVMAAAYWKWGSAAFERLNGMWAIAIYDHRVDTLTLSRDRFGEKPLFYRHSNDGFAFGSEMGSLLHLTDLHAIPDQESLGKFYATGASGQLSNSFIEGISKLPPASNLTYDCVANTFSVARYYDIGDVPNGRRDNPNSGGSEKSEAEKKTLNLLEKAVRIRLRSDVPVGISLSGGIDSSAVACLAKRCAESDVHTFSAYYDDDVLDSFEFETAKRLSEDLGLIFHRIDLNLDTFLSDWRSCIRRLGAPHASPAMITSMQIMRAASRHVTVILEGQGADEIFGGYKTLIVAPAALGALKRGKLGGAFKELNHLVDLGKIDGGAAGIDVVRSILFFVRYLFPGATHLYRRVAGHDSVFNSQIRRASRSEHGEWGTGRWSADPINASLRSQIDNTLPNLLAYGDAVSMHASIENRNPFLDHDLVNHAFSLPGTVKYKSGITKSHLRSALRGIVPDEILDRRAKIGFVSPLARIFRTKHDDTLGKVFAGRSGLSDGIYDMDQVNRLIQQHLSGKKDHSHLLFKIASIELFLQSIESRN